MGRAALLALVVSIIAIERAIVSYSLMGYMDTLTTSRYAQKAESRKGWHNDWMKVERRDHGHAGGITARQSFARQRVSFSVSGRNR